jgi:GNAT superfamily N-acetyltransferase
MINVRFKLGGGGCISQLTLTGSVPGALLELTDVFVHPRRRRRGEARQLLQEAVAYADAHGYDLWLRVAPHGKDSAPSAVLQQLYREVGFRATREPRIMRRRCSSQR